MAGRLGEGGVSISKKIVILTWGLRYNDDGRTSIYKQVKSEKNHTFRF